MLVRVFLGDGGSVCKQDSREPGFGKMGNRIRAFPGGWRKVGL